MQVQMASGSDCGLVRERNEDRVLILPEHGLAILSDGMGGHRAGDIASRIAVEVVAECLTRPKATAQDADVDTAPPPPQAQDLRRAIEAANAEIMGTARDRPECFGMGATIVVASLRGGQFLVAHLGDSRAYRMHEGGLQQLTEDHTLAQQYLQEGGSEFSLGYFEYARSMLLRGLGIGDALEPDISECELVRGDLFLLCSDGLTDALSDSRIRDILLSEHNDLEELVHKLIGAANDNGGPDNITVALIRVEP